MALESFPTFLSVPLVHGEPSGKLGSAEERKGREMNFFLPLTFIPVNRWPVYDRPQFRHGDKVESLKPQADSIIGL